MLAMNGTQNLLVSYRGNTFSLLPRTQEAGSSIWNAEGNQAIANFGHSVAGAGDVNNDDYDDIIVGAYRYDNGSQAGWRQADCCKPCPGRFELIGIAGIIR